MLLNRVQGKFLDGKFEGFQGSRPRAPNQREMAVPRVAPSQGSHRLLLGHVHQPYVNNPVILIRRGWPVRRSGQLLRERRGDRQPRGCSVPGTPEFPHHLNKRGRGLCRRLGIDDCSSGWNLAPGRQVFHGEEHLDVVGCPGLVPRTDGRCLELLGRLSAPGDKRPPGRVHGNPSGRRAVDDVLGFDA